ncbi:hypothetical protein MRX96_012304 [Rhipicephalus microplus]
MTPAPPPPPPGLQQPQPLDFDTTSEDIFVTFNLFAEGSKKFELAKEKFDEYLMKDTNVVYESTCFHKRHQMPGESIDQFMTALHILAEQCDFGEFKQRLIRDRFVVGQRYEKLSRVAPNGTEGISRDRSSEGPPERDSSAATSRASHLQRSSRQHSVQSL